MEDVDNQISELKEFYGETFDSGLADRLGIHKSTISGWRQRGSVPKRYMEAPKILQPETKEHGQNPYMPPVFRAVFDKWNELERAAFKLAICRFMLDHQPVRHDYVVILRMSSEGVTKIWSLAHEAYHDILTLRHKRQTITFDDAVATLIYEEMYGPAEGPQT